MNYLVNFLSRSYDALQKVTHFGVSIRYPRWKNRGIIITNNLALICASIFTMLIVIHRFTHPGEQVIYFVLPMALLLFSIPYINKFGKVNTSRTLLTICLVVGSLLMTLVRKMTSIDVVSVNTFYQPRTAILFFSIIPFATIHFSERGLLVFNLLLGLLALLFFDPLHNLMGVGYHQLGHSDPDYYYTNIIFLLMYVIVVGCVAFFKRVIDRYEIENEILITSLHANTTLIENQKEELQSQGEILRKVLQEKDSDLSKVTQELVKFNHDLLQYSYAISHNLRGPVARILGLLNLIKLEGDPVKPFMLDHILTSTKDLDIIIQDLNTIIETRIDSYAIREKVAFEEIVDQVVRQLSIPIHTYGLRVSKQFEAKEIFTAKARLNHIVFSLLSNAIQYRREGIAPEVRLRTYRKGDEVVLEIQDNGRGMDLNLYGGDLFKPFKQFHPEVSGKGIGLYLVKLQVERLHGRIEVRSTPDVGTTFLFYLKDWMEEKSKSSV